jgi:RTX calcium-binding nonapeptide repeat (4 copies)
VSPGGGAIDGQVGMGTTFTGNVLLAGALHELTHAMGRIAGLSLDVFRFNENRSGARVFGFADPATPAYFSIDGGVTDLADFGINSDPGDFLNGGVQGTDPFNETVGGNSLTATDLQIMDVLGFHRTDGGLDTVLDTASTNASLTIGATATGAISTVPESGSFTTSLDHDWLAVNLVAGHVYTFSAQATFSASDNLNDVAIDLRSSNRTILDSQGAVDAGANAASTFTYAATSSGTEYLDISAGGSNPASLTGIYQITATDSGFASPNGDYWINAYDTANTASWAWSTSAYEANGTLLSQTGLNDDGTHWLTMYDVDNRYNFSNATITFDSAWNWTSVSGTNDDGSHSVSAGTVAAAYDTLLWFETPYDPNSSSTAPLVLTGGAGNDVLAGHAGNDTLTGGPGNDILYGQDHYGPGGSNTFVFGPGFGQDRVMDFQAGQDTLQFSPSLLTSFAGAMADARQVGASTVITVDPNDSVTLVNVNMSSLTSSNFHFS